MVGEIWYEVKVFAIFRINKATFIAHEDYSQKWKLLTNILPWFPSVKGTIVLKNRHFLSLKGLIN